MPESKYFPSLFNHLLRLTAAAIISAMKKTICAFLVAFLPQGLPAQVKKPDAPAPSNVYRMEEGFVDAHGTLIYYKIIGKGAPLMIVHGGPGASHDYLLPYLLPLARTSRLVFIDERGSGRSERLEDTSQYTVEKMVEDVEDVRKALGLGKVSLLGHSYGGVLAQAYAFKYQGNLTHLILGGTFYSTAEMNKVLAEEKRSMPPEALAKLEAFEKAGLFGKGKDWEKGRYPDDYAKLAWGDGYFPYLYQKHPDPNYDPAAGNTTASWELYREMWGSNGEFVIDGNLKSVEYLDRLPSIHVPTLVICGDHDESNPRLSRTMNQEIAGSKLVVLPQAGHMAFVDQPNLYIRAVADFLKGK